MLNEKILKDRAKMFEKIRSFFSKKNILEVDCPSIVKAPSIDLHIESMETEVLEKEKGYLHTSPEYLMKRVISEKSLDIYQLSHVFRKSEIGDLHNPEFTLVEWYRKNISYEDFISEVMEFISLFLKDLPPLKKISYKEAFLKYANIDYIKASEKELSEVIKKNIHISKIDSSFDKDTLLSLIMSYIIEPKFPKNSPLLLYHYPPSQAALSKIIKINNEKVAERFEIYYKSFELANGYHELTDAKEQRNRFIQTNKERKLKGKRTLPIDDKFINALKEKMPDLYGIALGFDRLMMLRHKKQSIKDVILFPFDEL